MGISPNTVVNLTDAGHDAVHLVDEGLDRLPDSEILSKARIEERIVITHDLDFGDLMAASGARLPSVIIFRLANMAAVNVNRYLELIVKNHSEVLQQGAILSVSEQRIRVRTLPIVRTD